MHEVNH